MSATNVQAKTVMGVSDLIEVRRRIKELESRERDLVDILKDKGPGIYQENDSLAVVSLQSRSTVNISGLRTKYPREVDEFTGTTEFLVVRTMTI